MASRIFLHDLVSWRESGQELVLPTRLLVWSQFTELAGREKFLKNTLGILQERIRMQPSSAHSNADPISDLCYAV